MSCQCRWKGAQKESWLVIGDRQIHMNRAHLNMKGSNGAHDNVPVATPRAETRRQPAWT